MAARTGITVEGGRQFRATVRKAQPELLDQVKGAHDEVAAFVSSAARPNTPKGETGRLTATVRGAGTKTAAIIRAGRASVPYAGPRHFGWPARNIEPHPWITDTAQATEPAWTPIYEGAVQRVLGTIRGA